VQHSTALTTTSSTVAAQRVGPSVAHASEPQSAIVLYVCRYYRDEQQELEGDAAAARPQHDAQELLRQAEEQAEAAEVGTQAWLCANHNRRHSCILDTQTNKQQRVALFRLPMGQQQRAACPVLCGLLLVFASPMPQVQLMDEKSLRKMLNTFEKKVCVQHSMAWQSTAHGGNLKAVLCTEAECVWRSASSRVATSDPLHALRLPLLLLCRRPLLYALHPLLYAVITRPRRT
jgi:hypothetical protein